MNKEQDGSISEDSFKMQFCDIYNAIFNHKGDYKEYSNNEIMLNRDSYKYIMDALSLLKKELKY